MAEKGVGHRIEFTGHTALVHKQSHEDKQGDHGQAVVLCSVRYLPSDHGQGRAQPAFIKHAAAALVGEPERADKAHREDNRHPQKDENKNDTKTDQCSGHAWNSFRKRGAKRASSPEITIATAANVTPDAMNHIVRYCGIPRYSVTSP